MCQLSALLDFRFEICDKILKQHLHTALKNAAYSFKSIQNYLIFCCTEAPIQEIVKEIRPEEVKDCLNREQILAILVHVDTSDKTQEKLVLNRVEKLRKHFQNILHSKMRD